MAHEYVSFVQIHMNTTTSTRTHKLLCKVEVSPPQQPRYYQQPTRSCNSRTRCHDLYNLFTPVFSLLLSQPRTPRPHHCTMYEPHLVDLANQHSHGDHEGMSLLEELDKIAPIKSFDAFPKVRPFFFFFLFALKSIKKSSS